MSDTTALTLRLLPHFHERLRRQAALEGRSINGFIVHALTARLDNSEPAALDQRDSLEAMARAIQDNTERIDTLERVVRQAGAEF